MTMKIDIENIIVKVKLVEGKLKAICALDFGGEFVVRGYRVQESQYENERGEKLWVTPPSYLGGGKWHPTAYFTNSEVWKQVENKILDAYQEANKVRYTKAYGLSNDEADELFK